MVRRTRGGCESVWESVFHVLNFEVLPTPIFTTLFSRAAHFGGELPQIVRNAGKSILRKRVYSFKHSGNSRGDHRGPEIVSPDRQTRAQNGRFSGTRHFWHQENIMNDLVVPEGFLGSAVEQS